MRLGNRKMWIPGLAASLGTVALLIAGCGSTSPSGPTLAKDQVFHYNYPDGATDIATMDPQQVQDTGSYGVVQLVFDGLVEQDQNLAVEHWGAKSWDVSSDGLTYTFHLQAGQQFSNGTPVTSTDYAYSINRVIDPCVASPVSYYLTGTANELIKDSVTFNQEKCTDPKAHTLAPGTGQTVPLITTLVGDSILTPDDQTLVIKLSNPAAYFLEAMTYPVTYAVDPSVVGPVLSDETWTDKLYQGATGQGGSGMFYMAKWDHNSGIIVLKQNPHWWGLSAGKKPYLSEIDFTVFAKSDTAYAAYQAGQFDVGNPTTQLLAQAKQQPDFHSVGALTYFGIDFNYKKAPFDDLNARKAFCLAVNRDLLNSSILKNAAIPHWNIVPKGMPGYNPNVTGPEGVTATSGDATKAAADWATYKSSHSTIPALSYLYVNSSTSSQQLATALVAQWQQTLGATVTLNGEDFNKFVADDDAGNFQITRFGWQDDYPDPQDFLTLLFSTGAQYNSQKASVPAADTLMFAADKESDVAGRLAKYNQAEQLLINDVATCPLYQSQSFYQLRAYVHGWAINAGGAPSLDSWIATYIAPH